MCVELPIATPVTEFVPVAFDVPPVPPIEMAPPLDDSIRLDALANMPRAEPVAEVPAVPLIAIDPTPLRTDAPVGVRLLLMDTPFALPLVAAVPPKPVSVMLPNPVWTPPSSETSMPCV